MAGERFWQSKDPQVISQFVGLPLEFMKRTLDEKQRQRDIIKQQVEDYDWKNPQQLEWNEEHTAAVKAYNDEAKKRHDTMKDALYNGTIDNVNTVARDIYKNKQWIKNEWQKGTGRAYNLQRLYGTYQSKLKDEQDRLEKKDILETDMSKGIWLTQQEFNKQTSGKDLWNNNDVLSKTSLNYQQAAAHLDIDEEARKAVEKMHESGYSTVNQNGYQIRIDNIEGISYDEAVKNARNQIMSNPKAQAYIQFQKKYNLGKNVDYGQLDDVTKQDMLTELKSRSKRLYEYASGDDWIDAGRSKNPQENYNKSLQDKAYDKTYLQQRFGKSNLDDLSNKELTELYTEDNMLSRAVGSAASNVSYSKNKLDLQFDPYLVQTMAHRANKDYDMAMEAKQRQEQEMLEMQSFYDETGVDGEGQLTLPDIQDNIASSLGMSALNGLIGLGVSLGVSLYDTESAKKGKTTTDQLMNWARQQWKSNKTLEDMMSTEGGKVGTYTFYDYSKQNPKGSYEDYIKDVVNKANIINNAKRERIPWMSNLDKTSLENADRSIFGDRKIIYDSTTGKITNVIGFKNEAMNKTVTYTRPADKGGKITNAKIKDMLEDYGIDEDSQDYKNFMATIGTTGSTTADNDEAIRGKLRFAFAKEDGTTIPIYSEGSRQLREMTDHLGKIIRPTSGSFSGWVKPNQIIFTDANGTPQSVHGNVETKKITMYQVGDRLYKAEDWEKRRNLKEFANVKAERIPNFYNVSDDDGEAIQSFRNNDGSYDIRALTLSTQFGDNWHKMIPTTNLGNTKNVSQHGQIYTPYKTTSKDVKKTVSSSTTNEPDDTE